MWTISQSNYGIISGGYRNRTDQPRIVQGFCGYPAHPPQEYKIIITQVCSSVNCKKEYQADSREVKRGNAKYCSRACSGEALRLKRATEKENKAPNAVCAFCKTLMTIPESRKSNSKSGLFFCSREHQALGFKDPKIQVKSGPNTSKRSTCLTQGCKTKTEKEFCQKCKLESDKQLWLSGDNSVTWSGATREPRSFVKKYLKELRGDKCEWCNYSKKRPDGTSKIQMDHIDGNYTNNALSNLRLLCPNCHEDTPTFGSRNQNGGRRYRLKYSHP